MIPRTVVVFLLLLAVRAAAAPLPPAQPAPPASAKNATSAPAKPSPPTEGTAASTPTSTPAPAAKDAKDEKPKWDVATADLGPTQPLKYTVREGTWMSLDVSPDGRTVVFDLLGAIYRMPITGGRAERLRGGRAWHVQPRYSPDGRWISFTSDAGGGDNIWVMDADGHDARAITKEDFRLLNNATWTPDGRSIIARKHFTSRRSLGAGEMWLYDVASGGEGLQLTTKQSEQKDAGEPEISPDGRWLYYSLDVSPGKDFEYNKDPNGTIYAIRRVDLQTGQETTVVSEPGGAVRPEVSPDGKQLAFVHRVRLKTVLMVRDLDSGKERLLFDGLSRDTQETWSVFGVYPGFAWTPDGKSIVIWAEGKIVRVDVASGKVAPIPFEAEIEKDITQALRFSPDLGGSTFPVKAIHWPRVSPDGEHVVFQALGHLWTRELPDGAPRRLTRDDDFECHPAWSPDGRWIVYTTWNDADGGRVRTIRASGGRSRIVVARPGHYAEPRVSPDGKWIVYRRADGDTYRGNLFATDPGIYVVRTQGGDPRLVTPTGSAPRWGKSGDRIIVFEGGEEMRRLVSLDLFGSDRREIASSERAVDMVLSPDGRWIAFQELWELYVAPRPATGRIEALGPEMKSVPVRKVSKVAGEFIDWSPDSSELRFGLGPDLYRVNVAPLFVHAEKPPEADATVTHLGWDAKTDVPDTDLALVNATVLTMDHDQVIDDGVVRVQGNRITAVGHRRTMDLAGVKTVDLGGRVVMPGLVDVHSHMGSSNIDTPAQVNWAYLANLAFGVTTTHDPSNDTGMVFASSELVRSGALLGPRVTSTGTVLYGAEGDFKAVTNNLEDARRHLERLKAYGAFSAKSYNQPRREQRQWYIRAARDLGMMIVPEGGSMYGHDLTMIVDGHTTVEHALPIAPLYDDALTLMSRSQTGYTPTLIVGYGGLFGETYWYEHDAVWENERLLHFVPRDVVDPRSRRRRIVPEGEYHHVDLARAAAEVARRGGNVELGAHGQMQGIGAHWELWMFGQGGLTPMEALHVATINGARALGMDGQVGTIEAGKLADLIVLDADPRTDLRNSEKVGLVMINGRIYDAATMAEVEPTQKAAPVSPAINAIPPSVLGHLGECLAE